MTEPRNGTIKTADLEGGEKRFRRNAVTVFHGSENIIERPVFGFGKRTNDYGLGFYCTEVRTFAGEWSVTPLHGGLINRMNQERIRPDDPRLQ